MGVHRESSTFIPKVVSYDVYDETTGKYVVEDHYGHLGANGTKPVVSDGYRNWFGSPQRATEVTYRKTTVDADKAAHARKVREAAIARKVREQAEWLKRHG